MPEVMDIQVVGNVINLSRNQWRGHVAKITNDPVLLEEVKKYTWTYKDGKHPYLYSSKLKKYFHVFVLENIYGPENIARMKVEGNIIEHLDNNGLNCTYENLHIISEDLNKGKAFTIDKKAAELEERELFPAYIMDVYYLHDSKQFQLQIFMTEDLYFNKASGRAAEMFICMYDNFEDLYVDWFYLLNRRNDRKFELGTLHAQNIIPKERPYIKLQPGEENSPFIIRDGVTYLNLDTMDAGKPMSVIRHTAMRNVVNENK